MADGLSVLVEDSWKLKAPGSAGGAYRQDEPVIRSHIAAPAFEVVRGCAKALNVPMIELLGSEDNTNGRKRRGTGPTGKMRRLFEAASQLPRSQQEKITALLEPSIAH